MNQPIVITDIDELAKYNFTLVEKNEDDMNILKDMTQFLVEKLTTITTFVDTSPFIFFTEKDNLIQRTIVYNYKKLQKKKRLWFVGFMGHKKKTTTLSETIGNIDWEISQSLVNNSELLSYSSQALPDGNWFNFVLFEKSIAKKRITTNEKHKYAAHILAPKHFSWIRLHNGMYINGIQESKNITLFSTKYYYFENNTPWFGKRVYMVQ